MSPTRALSQPADFDGIRRHPFDPVVWAGIATIFLSQMPVMDSTALGQVSRFALLLGATTLVLTRLPLIAAQLTLLERLTLGYLLALVMVGTVAGLIAGFTPEPAEIMRFAGINVVCYALSRCLLSADQCERFLKIYHYVAIIACCQAIASVALDLAGARQTFAVPILVEADRRYFLPWFGLLGGDVGNFRTNFYFSESTYFAQMLIPAIAYAIVMRRRVGVIILILGFATTSAAGAAIALAVALLLMVFRLRIRLWVGLAYVVFLIVAGVTALRFIDDLTIVERLLDRGTSMEDKLNMFSVLWQQLQDHPWGVGPLNLHREFGGFVNTANGFYQLFVPYGVLAVPLVLVLFGTLLRIGVLSPSGPRSAALAIGLLAAMASGTTHGPLLKYYAVFLLGVTLTLHRYEAQSARLE